MHEILKQKVYHDGTSMIVLKPGDLHEVPERYIQDWIDEGIIDDDGEVDAEALRARFKVSHLKFGEFLIEGPGVEPGTKIKGKKDAETFIDGIIAARLGDRDETDAPV